MDYTAQGIQHFVRVQLLDRVTGAEVAQVEGVKAAKVEWNLNRAVRGGGSLTVDLRQQIEWRKLDVRLWVVLSHGGVLEPHPMLTGRPTVSEAERDTGATRIEVVLHDTTTVLDRPLGATRVATAGSNALSHVEAVLAAAGVAGASITPSSATLRSDMTWEPADTFRRVINDALEAIGYQAIYATPRGQLVAEPYRLPGDRPDMFPLEPGPAAIHRADMKVSITDQVPNWFLVVSRGDGETEPLTAVGQNLDPNNPWSVPNQGLVPADPYEIEAASQETVDAYLARVMAEWVWRPRMFDVEWRYFPINQTRQLHLGDVGTLRADGYSRAGVEVAEPISCRVSVEAMSWSWQDGQPLSLVSGTLKEVSADGVA